MENFNLNKNNDDDYIIGKGFEINSDDNISRKKVF